MTEHHPAIAEQISLQEEQIARYQTDIENLQLERERLESELQRHECMLAAYIDAEQRFSEYGAAWHGLPAPPEAINTTGAITLDQLAGKVPFEPPPDERPAKRVRRDVRGAVMTCFAAEGNHLLSENFVVERTGLPATSLRSYLLRAVKAGELVREGDLYRLPQPAPPPSLDDFNFSGDNDAHGEAEEWTPVSRADADAGRWPPSPEKIVDRIRRSGDMGMSREELRIIGATDDQIADLLSAGKLSVEANIKSAIYRIAEDSEESAP